MKKDRNAFFESSQFSSSYTPQMMNPQMMNPLMINNNMMPYQSASNSSSFYSGPDPMMNTYPSNNLNNDYDTKISRLERQVQKLDNRLTKLEEASFKNDETNITSNMYML